MLKALSITQRVTITQATLTLFVVAASGFFIYEFVAAKVEGESRMAAEAAAYRTSQEILAQLGRSAPAVFVAEASPLAGLTAAASDWAIVRGSEAVLAAGGELGRDAAFLRAALEGGDVVQIGDRLSRIVSLPLPRPRSAALSDLPEPVQRAVGVVRRHKFPDASYVCAWRDRDEHVEAWEVELLEGDRLIELDVGADGKRVEVDIVPLPRSFSPGFVAGVLGASHGAPFSPAGWRVHDGELLAVVDPGDGPAAERERFAVNRYGERFSVGEDGALSPPKEESTIRILVASDATDASHALHSLLTSLWVGAPLVWLSVVGIGWFVTRRAFSPVRRILDAANRIEPLQLGARLPTGNVHDELYNIAETINHVLDRLESGFHRERRFTADASHELRGPLTKVIAEIDIALARERGPEDYRAALGRCRSYAETLRRIVEALLLLTRLDQGDDVRDLEAVDVQAVLVDTVPSFSGDDRSRVSLELADSGEPLIVLGRADLLGVLVRNLLENALRYSPPGAEVAVRVSAGEERVVVQVEDRGPGVPPDLRERVFDPFFRLEPSRSRQGGGSGLGLSIVRSIAKVHRAKVELLPRPAGGTTARVSLPLSRAAPTREPEESDHGGPAIEPGRAVGEPEAVASPGRRAVTPPAPAGGGA